VPEFSKFAIIAAGVRRLVSGGIVFVVVTLVALIMGIGAGLLVAAVVSAVLR
jgi:hypothetical protein